MVEVGSWSWPSLVAWLLLVQTDFEVLDQPELVQAIKEVGARVAAGVSGGQRLTGEPYP